MNTLKVSDDKWLFNGEGFAKEVFGFGDLSRWEEVTDEFKKQWDSEHPGELPPEILNDNE